MDWKTFGKISSDSEQDKAELHNVVKTFLGTGGIAVLATVLQMKMQAAIDAKDLTMTLIYRLASSNLNDIALSLFEDGLQKDKPTG